MAWCEVSRRRCGSDRNRCTPAGRYAPPTWLMSRYFQSVVCPAWPRNASMLAWRAGPSSGPGRLFMFSTMRKPCSMAAVHTPPAPLPSAMNSAASPVADAADAANRQAMGGRVTGNLRHHVQRDRLHRRAAVTAMGALVTDDGVSDHAVKVDAGDRVDGVDQRHCIGPAAMRSPCRLADVGDVRRQLDDHRQRAVLLTSG